MPASRDVSATCASTVARRRRPRRGRRVCRRSPNERDERGCILALLHEFRVGVDQGHGLCQQVLGTRVTLDGQRWYTLDQEEAIRYLLRENGLADAKSTWTPIDDS